MRYTVIEPVFTGVVILVMSACDLIPHTQQVTYAHEVAISIVACCITDPVDIWWLASLSGYKSLGCDYCDGQRCE